MMAHKLVLEFEGTTGAARFSFNYADPETTTANVKALMAGLIANGSLFENPPTVAKAAKIVTTTETDYDLSA